MKVRLVGIDFPEHNPPFSQETTPFVDQLCHDKTLRTKDKGQDHHSRTLGVVLVDDKNVNQELFETGLAWNFKRYHKDSELAAFEDATQAAALISNSHLA